MKVRGSGKEAEKIDINMTPMIDIVFQLLTFFIMSLKIAAAEGDFNIKMPLSAPRQGQPDDRELPPFRLRMTANADGTLKTLRLDQNTLRANLDPKDEDGRAGAFAALRQEVISRVGDDRGPGSIASTAEVEIDADYNLDYEHVIAAITSVSGYVSPTDRKSVVKLIEKVKFAPPRKPS
jgi:biopolymer transport protein ExbD